MRVRSDHQQKNRRNIVRNIDRFLFLLERRAPLSRERAQLAGRLRRVRAHYAMGRRHARQEHKRHLRNERAKQRRRA